MSNDQEFELKFACGPEDLALVLAAAPKARAAGDDETRELISVYFDTPDLILQKAGASLRVREHKGQRIQTLKRGMGPVREEHETAIEGLAPDPALEPLPAMLPRGADLRPAFNVRVSRRQRTFTYKGARIELALDQGEVAGGERRSPICEVELELKSGPPEALFALARKLAAAAPLYLAFESKAARGQSLVAGGPPAARKGKPVVLDAGATAAAAFQAVAVSALAQIADNAALLRAAPGEEAVHQLRVGARRLRSAMATFKPLLEGDAGAEAVKADLRWLSAACEKARGLDVFALETLGDAEAETDPPPGLQALRVAIDLARAAAWRRAAEACGSARYRALMIDATAWVQTGAWLKTPAALDPADRLARQALKRHRRKLEARGAEARSGDDAARHRLRIEAKKLRYAVEAFASLYGDKAVQRYLRPLRELQDALGQLNDIATAEPLIAGLGLPSEAAFAAGDLVGRRAARSAGLIKQSHKALARLDAAEPFWT